MAETIAETIDFTYDTIGKRLSGEGLTEHEALLAKDDQVRVQWVLDRLRPYRRVIDVGASDGAIAQLLHSRNHQVCAIEPHPRHYNAMQVLDGDGQIDTFTISAQVAFKHLGPDDYDAMLIGEVLEHLSDEDGTDILVAARRLVDTLVVTVPNAHCASFQPLRQRDDWPDHRQHFSAQAVVQLLSSCGWRARVMPIVGDLGNSIWLGAVAWRA